MYDPISEPKSDPFQFLALKPNCNSRRGTDRRREREVHPIPKIAKMDWQGQRRAEMLMQVMLVVFGVVALVVGYSMGSFRTMMLIYAGGVTLTALITVPNWPCFNRHPLNWLEPSEAEKHPKPQPVAPKKKGGKHHHK